jgi:hypothetical protein
MAGVRVISWGYLNTTTTTTTAAARCMAPRRAAMRDSPRPAPPSALFLRPRAGLVAWAGLGASERVLRVLRRGVRLKFNQQPPPYCGPAIPVQAEDRSWLQEEISVNLERGSWVRADKRPVYCAPAFIVRSAAGKRRVVIDLRTINAYLKGRGVRYDTLATLRRTLQRGSWFISFDLHAGYHHVGVHPDSVRYLGFELDGAYYYCTALPFGLMTAPRTFTKVMRALVAHWRGKGYDTLPYLDDFLFAFPSEDAARAAARDIDDTLKACGLERNRDKGCWVPTQRIEHLGMTIDAERMLFLATPKQEQRVRAFAADILHMAARRTRVVPVRVLAAFAGLAQSLRLAVPEARLQTLSLYRCFTPLPRGGWGGKVRVSSAAQACLRWWRDAQWAGGAPIDPPQPELTVASDASDIGWGGVVLGTPHQCGGHFTVGELQAPIMQRELLAVGLTMQALAPQLQGRSVEWRSTTERRRSRSSISAAATLPQRPSSRQSGGRRCDSASACW